MNYCTVILAGGLGTRMRSNRKKLLHSIMGKTIIGRTIEAVLSASPAKCILVLNNSSDDIRQSISRYPNLTIAIQKEPLGTGDALKSAIPDIPNDSEAVLILNGDTPLIMPDTLSRFVSIFKASSANLGLLSFIVENPSEYGRIIREGDKVTAIIENKDANQEQRDIREVNSGIYLMDRKALHLLNNINKNPLKGEYYLTDIVSLCVKQGLKVSAFDITDERELMGINTREELSRAIAVLRDRIVQYWINNGVTFIEPASTFIDPEAQIGMDTIIYPNVIIEGNTVLGRGCVIYPNTRIHHSIIEEDVIIKDSSVIEESKIKKGATVGPFAHLRHGALIGEEARIGNFVEVKKSSIGRGVKASHLSYIGDAEIGEGSNIGAGTITCNYDGTNKHRTVIEKGVFVGSDTQFVAPVRVGEGSYIGAGSTITKDVPPNSLGISRSQQRNLIDWVEKRKRRCAE